MSLFSGVMDLNKHATNQGSYWHDVAKQKIEQNRLEKMTTTTKQAVESIHKA